MYYVCNEDPCKIRKSTIYTVTVSKCVEKVLTNSIKYRQLMIHGAISIQASAVI